MARQHNDANVLCLAARGVAADVNERVLRAFLDAEFEGGRHQRRVDKMMALEGQRNI
jgi:ribose 5-phosphate isomerase B